MFVIKKLTDGELFSLYIILNIGQSMHIWRPAGISTINHDSTVIAIRYSSE
jgi:hypothetical protein